jgi:hypothetical protein
MRWAPFVMLLLFAACAKTTGQEGKDAQVAAVVKPAADTPADRPTPTCAADADCRLFDDYCTGCDCRALAQGEPDPVCKGPGVRCIRQPCGDRRAVCDKGKCLVR